MKPVNAGLVLEAAVESLTGVPRDADVRHARLWAGTCAFDVCSRERPESGS